MLQSAVSGLIAICCSVFFVASASRAELLPGQESLQNVQNGLQGIQNTVNGSLSAVEGVQSTVSDVSNQLNGLLQTPGATIGSMRTQVDQAISSLANANQAVDLVNTRLGQVNQVAGTINQQIDNFQALADIPGDLASQVSALPGNLMNDTLSGVTNGLNSIVNQNLSAINDLQQIKSILDTNAQTLGDLAAVPDALMSNIGGGIEGIAGSLGTATGMLGEVGGSLQSVSGTVSGLSGSVGNLANNLFGAGASGVAGMPPAATPTMDCSYSGPCEANGQTLSAESCRGVYGCCPREAMNEMATPCVSIIDTYHPYNTYLEHMDDEGFPYWTRKQDLAVRSVFNPGGAPVCGYAAKTRLLGDDPCLNEDSGGGDACAGRVRCCKRVLEKGTDDPCLWRHELGLCLANSALGGAGDPFTPGSTQTYAGQPDIVCQQQPTGSHDPNVFNDHMDFAERNDPGQLLAMEVQRQGPQPTNLAFIVGGFEKLDVLARRGPGAFMTGPGIFNPNYGRSPEDNPIQLAENKLWLTTPPYATYDPHDYRPGQEKKLAEKLFNKTPLEIARLRSQDPLLGGQAHAYGLGSTANLQNIMCDVEPATCHLTSHFDRAASGALSSALGSISGFSVDAGGLIRNATSFTGSLNNITNSLGNFTGGFGDYLQDAASLTDTVRSLTGDLPVLGALQSGIGGAQDLFNQANGIVNQTIGQVDQTVNQAIGQAEQLANQAATQAVNEAMTRITDFPGGVGEVVNLVGQADQAIGGALSGLNRITEGFNGVVAGVNGVAERYWVGLDLVPQIAFPAITFVPDVSQLFSEAESLVADLGGGMLADLYGAMNRTAGAIAAVSGNDFGRCVSSMLVDTGGDTLHHLRLKESYMRTHCSPPLLECLQGRGNVSEATLDHCYQVLVQPDNSRRISRALEDKDRYMAALELHRQLRAQGREVQVASLFDLFNDATDAANTVNDAVNSAGEMIDNYNEAIDRFGNAANDMSSVADAMFGGNPLATIGGQLTPFNLDSQLAELGDQANTILNQATTGLSGLGGLDGIAAGSNLFGAENTQAVGRTLNEFKSTNYQQIFDPSHLYDVRAKFNMFPERDHYSKCATQNTCYVSKNEARYDFWAPWYTDPEEAPTSQSGNDSLIQSRPDYSQPTQYSGPFGGAPSPASIGMSDTTHDTGPVLFQADGKAHYARQPETELQLKARRIYYSPEHLPAETDEALLASLPKPSPAQTVWDELAARVDENGSLASASQEEIDYFVKKVNEEFARQGIDAAVSEDVFKPSPVDHFMQPGEELAGSGFSVDRLLEGLGVGQAHAVTGISAAVSLPGGANTDFGVSGYDSRDVVRCSGQRDVNQIRVDVMQNRYKRFNSHMLQRITYNRWCYADMLDPLRCQPGGKVCAPKPCHPVRPCWSKKCWSNPCSPPPHILEGPSSEFPVAAVRWDYGDRRNDIAYAKAINPVCPRVETPLGETEYGDCHFYMYRCPGNGERMTRAYNCRVYGNGKRYCGYSWAYHPDVKFVLDVWADTMGGDFAWPAGERHMADECHHLAMPLPLINKLRFASMEEIRSQGQQAAEGTCFPAYFGMRRPYVALDVSGLEYGQPPGQRPDYYSNKGAYICLHTATSDSAPTKAARILGNLIDHLLTPQQQRKQDGLLLAAQAALPSGGGSPLSGGLSLGTGNLSSNQCCFGGLGGRTGGGCGEHGYGTQFGGMLEQMLLQARTHREFGLKCIPHYARTHYWRGPEGMVSEMLAAQFTVRTQTPGSDSTARDSGVLRTMTYPMACRGYLQHPDPTQQWPYGGGAQNPTIQTGADALLNLGAEAGGAVMILDRGGAFPDEKPGMRNLAVVTNVSRRRGYIDVVMTNAGLWPDACGSNSGTGQRVNRRFYRRGELPASISAVLDRLNYPTKSCVMAGNALGTCEFGEWDSVRWVHFGNPENLNTQAPGADDASEVSLLAEPKESTP